MPDEELGTVIPELSTIATTKQDLTRQPAFDWRFLRVGWGRDTPTLLWYKRQKLGVSEMVWMCHGTPHVTHFAQEAHPEYFARVGAGRVLPRLAPPLRDAMIRYADAFFTRYPELNHVSVGPADAFTSIDERDVAAGWLREERDASGRLSEYVWTFIDEVAAGVAEKHPDKIVMGLAYSYYREPPEPGAPWGINVCRSRFVTRKAENSAIAPTGGRLFTPPKFGNLIVG